MIFGKCCFTVNRSCCSSCSSSKLRNITYWEHSSSRDIVDHNLFATTMWKQDASYQIAAGMNMIEYVWITCISCISTTYIHPHLHKLLYCHTEFILPHLLCTWDYDFSEWLPPISLVHLLIYGGSFMGMHWNFGLPFAMENRYVYKVNQCKSSINRPCSSIFPRWITVIFSMDMETPPWVSLLSKNLDIFREISQPPWETPETFPRSAASSCSERWHSRLRETSRAL